MVWYKYKSTQKRDAGQERALNPEPAFAYDPLDILRDIVEGKGKKKKKLAKGRARKINAISFDRPVAGAVSKQPLIRHDTGFDTTYAKEMNST